jgi:hypothetical protein
MLRLYNERSGAQDVELLREISPEAWGRIQRNLLRVLKESGYSDVVELLKSNAFELWDATNGFNDQFNVLIYVRPPESTSSWSLRSTTVPMAASTELS